MADGGRALDIRAPTPRDASGVVDLFRSAGYPYDERTHAWSDRASPYGHAIARIASDEGLTIGHYAVLPRPVHVGSRVVRSGIAVQAVVRPGHRDLRTILRLCQDVYAACREDGIVFVYGFPNDRIWLVKTRLLGWLGLWDIRWLAAPLDLLREAVASSGTGAVVRTSGLSERHERLWGPLPDRSVICARSAAYLNWRYRDRPDVDYRIFDLDVAGGDRGTVVTKIHRGSSPPRGHIVDLAVDSDRDRVIADLVAAALPAFEAEGVGSVSCWALPGSSHRSSLERIGFAESDLTTHFGVVVVGDRVDREVLDMSQWQLAMGDSDAF